MTTFKKRARRHRNCRACRERHTKCDDRASACRYCLWNNIECVRSVDVRFRNCSEPGLSRFPPGQTWLPQRANIRYHDETTRTAQICALSECSRLTETGEEPIPGKNLENSDHQDHDPATTSETITENYFDESPTDLMDHEMFTDSTNDLLPMAHVTQPAQRQSREQRTPRITFCTSFTYREAELLRNFSENMAIWADVTDYERNFEYEVPRRALTSPVLRFAVFAFSARHMNRFGRGACAEALQYHNKCLELLIPVLSEDEEEMTDNILAAVGILRMDEEMEDFDTECHLKGAIRLLNQTPLLCSQGGLGEAAALLCLRQDMYISLIHQQPLRIRPAIFEGSTSVKRVDDLGWTNQMILLLARILSASYSPSIPKSDELASLQDEVDFWMRDKPSTFEPLLNLSRNKTCNRRIPVLWMLSPTQVIGLQYYHIAKLVLATAPNQQANDSRSFLQRSKDVEKRVRKHLLAILGLATSNPKAENALFMARHMLVVWGGVLTDELDQAAAECFLRDMEGKTGWSMTRLISDLADQWNSSDNEDG